MAAGRAKVPEISSIVLDHGLDSKTFIGEPCPTKRAGRFLVVGSLVIFMTKKINNSDQFFHFLEKGHLLAPGASVSWQAHLDSRQGFRQSEQFCGKG